MSVLSYSVTSRSEELQECEGETGKLCRAAVCGNLQPGPGDLEV